MSIVFNVVEEIQASQSKTKKKININTQDTFKSLINKVKDQFNLYFKDESTNNEQKQDRLELYHQAVIGDKEAEIILTNEIASYLRSINVSNVPYPSYYTSLPQALFHELYRFGLLQKWYVMEDSPAAILTGDEFWIEKNDVFSRQEERLPSNSINEFINRFMAAHKNLKVNENNPYEEITLKDHTRVTIIVPPDVNQPTLVFRKYTVKNISIEEQAELGTISKEDIEFFKTTSQLYFNTVVSGHIKSGKSTFLKTIYGERDPKKVVVLIEGTKESFLKEDFPDRLVIELYTHNQDINTTIRRALRIDHDYPIVQEVRGIEAEGAIGGTERGRRGLLMSYHITNPENTTIQLAQHIVDEYPNRLQLNEIKRVSEALDIGITMASVNGKKRVTSLYEVGIDDANCPFINYLIYYNSGNKAWEYNSNISKELIKRMEEVDSELSNKFISHLKKQSKVQPMSFPPMKRINLSFFREEYS